MNVQRYARIAGVLFLVSLVAGGFGEAYVPSKLIVSGDAAATVANLRNFDFIRTREAGVGIKPGGGARAEPQELDTRNLVKPAKWPTEVRQC